MVDGADALLFDLGGVVLKIDFNLAIARWAEHAGCDHAIIRQRFPRTEAFKRHEKGEIAEDVFFADLRSALAIDISPAQLVDGWNAIFVGEMPGISDLLARAARQYPLYAFSNTNRTHELYYSKRFAGVLGHFREVYVSSTIGMRKPDAEAFDHVVKAIGAPAGRIVFFDDVPENVDGARASGLQAVHAKTTADVTAALAGLVR